MVNAVAIGQFVGHANNRGGQIGARILGVNRCLQGRVVGQVGVIQQRYGVALLRTAENYGVLAVPGIEAAAVSTAIVKIVACTVGDGVATCTGKNYVVTLIGANVVAIAAEHDIAA